MKSAPSARPARLPDLFLSEPPAPRNAILRRRAPREIYKEEQGNLSKAGQDS